MQAYGYSGEFYQDESQYCYCVRCGAAIPQLLHITLSRMGHRLRLLSDRGEAYIDYPDIDIVCRGCGRTLIEGE